MMYIMQNISVAETRQHLAEILGKVAHPEKASWLQKRDVRWRAFFRSISQKRS
jgi:hypothetical protein